MDLNPRHAPTPEPASGTPAAGETPDPVPRATVVRATPSRGAVSVEIGTLALEGFGPRTDPAAVTAAFRAELTRLVTRDGVPLAADGTDRALDGLTGLPSLPATASPERVGTALARAVHAGLSGAGADPGQRSTARPGRQRRRVR